MDTALGMVPFTPPSWSNPLDRQLSQETAHMDSHVQPKLNQSDPVREKMFPLPQWKTAVLGPTPKNPSWSLEDQEQQKKKPVYHQ